MWCSLIPTSLSTISSNIFPSDIWWASLLSAQPFGVAGRDSTTPFEATMSMSDTLMSLTPGRWWRRTVTISCLKADVWSKRAISFISSFPPFLALKWFGEKKFFSNQDLDSTDIEGNQQPTKISCNKLFINNYLLLTLNVLSSLTGSWFHNDQPHTLQMWELSETHLNFLFIYFWLCWVSVVI